MIVNICTALRTAHDTRLFFILQGNYREAVSEYCSTISIMAVMENEEHFVRILSTPEGVARSIARVGKLWDWPWACGVSWNSIHLLGMGVWDVPRGQWLLWESDSLALGFLALGAPRLSDAWWLLIIRGRKPSSDSDNIRTQPRQQTLFYVITKSIYYEWTNSKRMHHPRFD